MPIVDLEKIELRQPELIFALVAAVGTPIEHFTRLFRRNLKPRGYQVDTPIHASDFLKGLDLEKPFPQKGASEFDRINQLMDLGDELREKGPEALAILMAAHINAQRPEDHPRYLQGRAFIIRQLKHPSEVVWLRRIYRSACQVVSLYCPRLVRQRYLEEKGGMEADQAKKLIDRDEGEAQSWGQQLRDTFHHADAFIEVRAFGEADDYLEEQIQRYLDLLFGAGVISPTPEEYGMALAATAALRSLDLSRQVGAAIQTQSYEVIAVGANEVPAAGGGQYWAGPLDKRDYKLKYDSNAIMKWEILKEILAKTDREWKALTSRQRTARVRKVAKELEDARVMNLTEFGRAVHGEMEAMLAAARVGVSPKGGTLYTTTFPCHNCAKHIIDVGIARVVYIEPYAKSLASRLHEDAIVLVGEEGDGGDGEREDGDRANRVEFVPFLGIAPRSYHRLFSSVTEEGTRLERKDKHGFLTKNPLGLRFKEPPLSYIDREAEAALALAAQLTIPKES